MHLSFFPEPGIGGYEAGHAEVTFLRRYFQFLTLILLFFAWGLERASIGKSLRVNGVQDELPVAFVFSVP